MPASTLLRLLSVLALPGLMLAGTACTMQPEVRSAAPAVAAPAEIPRAVGPFVSAANPHAVAAGMAVLDRGGTAADAAVAVQAVLGLVEPQSSGLGGGAFMMWFDAEAGTVTVYDGRETAPAAATPELFWQDGRPLSFPDAVMSGRSTGVPGAVQGRRDPGGRRLCRQPATGRLYRLDPRTGPLALGQCLVHPGRRRAGQDRRCPDQPRLCRDGPRSRVGGRRGPV